MAITKLNLTSGDTPFDAADPRTFPAGFSDFEDDVVADVEALQASGVSLWWFDAGADASASRPAGAASTDVVIWTNTPSEPTNLGARDIWEDAS